MALGHTGWEEGWAVRYDAGIMEAVAHKRGIAEQPHMLAWSQATDADIGKTWLYVIGPAGSGRFLVVDLPRPGKDKQALIRRDIAVELGYANREEICGPHWSGRAIDCRVRIQVIR